MASPFSVILKGESIDFVEFAEPENRRWAKSKVCVSAVASDHAMDLRVGDFVLSANGRNISGLTYAEGLSVLRASRRPVKLSLTRPAAGSVSRFRMAERGQLLRRISTLARQIQVVHAQYEQTVQANAVVHGVRSDLHAKISVLTSRRAALARRQQRGYSEQYELLRLRRALAGGKDDKRGLARSVVQGRARRSELQAALDTLSFARRGVQGEIHELRARLAAGAAAAVETAGALAKAAPSPPSSPLPPPPCGWGAPARAALDTLTSIRTALVGAGQALLSLLHTGPRVVQLCAFLEGVVAEELRAEGQGVPDSAVFQVASPGGTSPSPLSTSFASDLEGAGQYEEALASLYMPITASGQALVEARDVLGEMRDTLTGAVAERVGAASAALAQLRADAPFLAGIALPEGGDIHACEAGALEDHMWSEVVGVGSDDVRVLRVVAGATALQLRTLHRLITHARITLGLPVVDSHPPHTPLPSHRPPSPDQGTVVSSISEGGQGEGEVGEGPARRARVQQ